MADKACIAKLMSIISAGCPCPRSPARFTSLPSARRYILLPSTITNSSMSGLSILVALDILSRSCLFISTLKWPELASMQPSFMYLKSSPETTSMFPVTVMSMSASLTASRIFITRYPSIRASRALIGSISVTITFAPNPAALMATPRPHHP